MSTQPAVHRTPGIPVTNASGQLTILSVTPYEEDHLSLRAIIGHSKWKLFTARDLASALSLLHDQEISVLLCERDLRPGKWIDVLEHITLLPHPPSLIVSSRLADDRLWAEALNLGAWDVLAKPFDHIGVIRSIKSAWQRWHDQIHPHALAARTMSAAN